MGYIEKRGPNSWRITVRLSTEDGRKYIRETLRFPDTMTEARQRREAEHALKRMEVEIQDGLHHLPAKNYTVATFPQRWMDEYITPHTSPNNAKTIGSMLNARILPDLGSIPLSQLTTLRLVSWIADLKKSTAITTALPDHKLKNPRYQKRQEQHETNKANPRTLSDRTVRHYYDALKSMLDKAVQWDILRANPMDNVDRPKVRKARARFLDDKEAIRLLRCLQHEPNMGYRAAILLALTCGLRLGEVGALKLSDVDWEAGTIDVTRALQYTAATGNIEGDPKSEAGFRVITLPDAMLTLLEETRLYQEDAAATFPGVWVGEGHIVHAWNGARLHHDTISKWFRRFADKHGFEGITFHQLRHTHATLLFADNIDAIAVATRMGHADPSVTMRTYAHALRRRDEDSARVMQRLLDNVPASPSFTLDPNTPVPDIRKP